MRARHYDELIEDLMTLEELHIARENPIGTLSNLELLYTPRIFKKDHQSRFKKHADSM
jgi:hypothetical protein